MVALMSCAAALYMQWCAASLTLGCNGFPFFFLLFFCADPFCAFSAYGEKLHHPTARAKCPTNTPSMLHVEVRVRSCVWRQEWPWWTRGTKSPE